MLQQFVSNTPLQVAKNLIFNNSNGIPVTFMLPIGMNGTVVNDSPTTGYISRIGSVLSTQIDLYNNVVTTLNSYNIAITNLQDAVAGLELSGNTIPNVNGYCFTGNANSPITTVTQLVAQSLCNYQEVLGSTSRLTQAILAEGASTLNPAPAFSNKSAMSGLTGWITNPETIADTINNLWLSYLDSRAGITTALNAITNTCQQVIVDFQAVYSASAGGFNIYFSGYSFIPSGYTDSGSTIVITDGLGGTLTGTLDIVQRAATGAPSLFLGISGTTLVKSTSSYSYTVQLNSVVSNRTLGNSCSKTVIHTTTGGHSGESSDIVTGTYQTSGITGSPPQTFQLVSNLPFKPSFVQVSAVDSGTATALLGGYYLTPTNTGASITLIGITGTESLNLNWIAYKPG